MQRFRVMALRPIEISATFTASEQPQVVRLDPGESRGGVKLVHRVIALEDSRRIDIVPHPGEIGETVTLEGLLELERIPS